MSDTNATTPNPEHHRHEAPPPKRNPYKIPFIVLAVLVGLAIIALLVWFFALRGGGSNPTPPPTTPTETTATSTPTQTVTPPPLAGPCTTDNSAVSLDEPNPAAGTTTVAIVFTNTSDADCTLEGFPTVEFVGDGNGTQIGATAAADASTTPELVTLAPGASAFSTLSITDAGNVCDPVDVDGFRVIPPGSDDAFFIETTAYQACADPNTELLKVTAIVPD